MTAILLPLRATAEIERTLQDTILDTSKVTLVEFADLAQYLQSGAIEHHGNIVCRQHSYHGFRGRHFDKPWKAQV